MGNTSLAIGGGVTFKNPENFILEGIAIELELKSSDFASIHSKDLIDTAILQVSLDKDNVMDLMMSRDLTENAQLEILNISTDKRSLRDKQEPYINNIVFESPMELRLYTVNDML
jgi:hypothetical protein